LEQWSQARSELAAALAVQAVAIALGSRRWISGFRWRGGLIVTAAEALAGREEVRVLSANDEQRHQVIGCDLTTDVALLKTMDAAEQFDTPAPAVRELNLGEGVVIVGRDARSALVSFGEVRLAGPAWRSRRGGAISQRLEFGADLDARFEGSLVADLRGGLCAMLVGGPHGRLLGIPASTIERIAAAVIAHGELPRPYLGLRLQPLWLDEATRTRWGRAVQRIAVVAGVEEASPAAAAGLQPGDLLDAIDGVALERIDALAAQLTQTGPGRVLRLRLRRGGQIQEVGVEIGQRPRPA
jgi:S1-C subfamily serine protease